MLAVDQDWILIGISKAEDSLCLERRESNSCCHMVSGQLAYKVLSLSYYIDDTILSYCLTVLLH